MFVVIFLLVYWMIFGNIMLYIVLFFILYLGYDYFKGVGFLFKDIFK